MNMKAVLVPLFVCLLVGSGVFAEGPVVIFDPLRKASETRSTDADEQILETLILPKIKNKWSGDTSCDGSNLTITGTADGSFTKKAAAQRAILYEMCQTGNGFANNGIAIIENGKVIANFTAEGGWNVDIVRIADIDKNGYDEIAIETGGGMHQGYTGSSTTVVEVSDTMVKSFGTFLTYTNECESLKPDEYCDRSYKITVTPGKKLSFFSQKYINNGNDEEPKWAASGKAKAAKAIAGTETKYVPVK